jgi:hypothetical protein
MSIYLVVEIQRGGRGITNRKVGPSVPHYAERLSDFSSRERVQLQRGNMSAVQRSHWKCEIGDTDGAIFRSRGSYPGD